jgi:hypothetical protein
MNTVAALFCLLGSASAFAPAVGRAPAMQRRVAPAARLAPASMLEAQDTWWGDKDYPSSIVLGIGKDVPSSIYGVTSAIALAVGLYCIAQSNLLNILSGSTVNGFYVAGALLVPYSWGLHVASWIQKQNGK